MLDLKALGTALEQLETERGIPKEKVIEAVEDALSAAYKKDYGKRGQIIKADFDIETGKTTFHQVKTVVDESMVKMEEEAEEDDDEEKEVLPRIKKVGEPEKKVAGGNHKGEEEADEEKKPRFNPEHHLLLEDARKIKKDTVPGEEIVFPLEAKDDYGRIAAQTAKQVIIQRIREAERLSVTEEYEKRKGEIVSGTVQRAERGNIYIDLGRITAVIPYEEQIPGERLRIGERVRAYLYAVEETPRDITLRLSRSHPKFLQKLIEVEVPEIGNETVEIKAIAREPGSRAKVAVMSHDQHIDPVGSCVGQRGVRVATVMSELGGEKIDIIEWSEDPETFIERSLSPAHIHTVTLHEDTHQAIVFVLPDQYSLAIGKGGQNARLAARLTGWKIDIREFTDKKEEGEEEIKGDEQEPQKPRGTLDEEQSGENPETEKSKDAREQADVDKDEDGKIENKE